MHVYSSIGVEAGVNRLYQPTVKMESRRYNHDWSRSEGASSYGACWQDAGWEIQQGNIYCIKGYCADGIFLLVILVHHLAA